MQEELTTLRPELIKTSDETDKLMVVIEKETRQVEEQRLVCLVVIYLMFCYMIFAVCLAGRS